MEADESTDAGARKQPAVIEKGTEAPKKEAMGKGKKGKELEVSEPNDPEAAQEKEKAKTRLVEKGRQKGRTPTLLKKHTKKMIKLERQG